MKAQRFFTVENDGFVGEYYGGPEESKKAVILMNMRLSRMTMVLS